MTDAERRDAEVRSIMNLTKNTQKEEKKEEKKPAKKQAKGNK